MSTFFSEKFDRLVPYTPGEQPQDKRYVKLNTNESPFPPSPCALEAAREAAARLNLYSDPECKNLVTAAAAHFHLKPDQIVCTNGSDEGINFTFMAYCDESTPAVYPDITYGLYSVFTDLYRLPSSVIPLKEDLTVDVDALCRAKGTIFLANPNAPTGIALPLSTVEKIIASDPGRIVAVDEAYVDFGAESCVPLIDRYPNLLVIQTFSKSRSLAGARLGLVMGQKELIADLNALRYSTNPYNVNSMTLAAGTAALNDDAYMKANAAEIMRVRKLSEEKLTALGFTLTPSSANFLFAKADWIGGKDLYLRLKEKGVLIRHFSSGRLEPWNRITVGSEEQMNVLFDRIAEIRRERA